MHILWWTKLASHPAPELDRDERDPVLAFREPPTQSETAQVPPQEVDLTLRLSWGKPQRALKNLDMRSWPRKWASDEGTEAGRPRYTYLWGSRVVQGAQ